LIDPLAPLRRFKYMSLPDTNQQAAQIALLKQEIERLKAENQLLTLSAATYKTDADHADHLLAGLEQFKLIADNIPVIVWTASPDGGVEYFNKRYSEYTGLSVQQSLGDGWLQVLHPDDLERTIQVWKESLRSNLAYEIQYRFRWGSDNTYRWQLGKALPLKDFNGKVIKWFGITTDIHEQKRAEQQKDEFLSIASHELKTPLTSVKAFMQLALKNAMPDEKAYGFISKSSSQLLRLESLINDLLDVSKINAGKMNYNLEPFEFSQALVETVEGIQQGSHKHRITIERNDGVIYKGDRLRIEQVINNLLANAIKYSPNNDQIIIRSELQENNLIISVQDFGIGIEPESLTKLFDRYYRVDNTSMRFQGLGLGLFISSEIIKRHNGSFWIESKPGEGSTFFFLLPVNGKQEFVDIETDHQTYYKGNFIEIKYLPEHQWLDVNWTGYQNYDSVKKGCLIMLDLLKKNNCSKVLNDNTYVMGNWSEAADWGGEFWFPAMQDAGLKHFAWIYSPSTFSRMSAHKSIDITMGKVTAQFFTDINEARTWLEKMD
jgi:PAS domain S-box-containing protein